MDADEPLRLPKVFQIGEDLATASIEELEERISALEQEIERIRARISSKRSSRQAADSVFKF